MKWHQALGLAPTGSATKDARASSRTTRAPRSTSSSTSAARSAYRRSRGSTTARDFDLAHQEYSGKKLEYFDQPNNERFMPFVIETSVGADRMTLAVL